MAGALKGNTDKNGTLYRRSLVALTLAVLGLGHVYLSQVQADRKRVADELESVTADLRAHQEALKISRQQCNAQLKRYQTAEEKTEALLNYYREGDHSRQKDWCKRLNENALAEYRLAAQKHLKEVKEEVARLTKERNELSDRLQPLALCCKSAYSKAQSLMAGASRDEALRKAADATRGSARALDDPHSVVKHSQRIEWTNPRDPYGGRRPVVISKSSSGGREASVSSSGGRGSSRGARPSSSSVSALPDGEIPTESLEAQVVPDEDGGARRLRRRLH